MLTVLLLLALQESRAASQTASAPASRPALPTTVRFGDSLTIPLDQLPEGGLALRLNITTVEPLTLMAESYDADVSIAVEDESGNVIAQDNDGGIETNAFLAWRPTTTGAVHVRLRAKSGDGGSATVTILRGELVPTPSEPKLAAIGYWDFAQDLARIRKDAARERLALESLARLEGRPDGAGALAARARRDAAVATARAKLTEASRLQSENALSASREALHTAITCLVEHEHCSEDAVIFGLLWDIGVRTDGLSALKDAATTWDSARKYCERTLPADHPDLLAARANLASTIRALGDLAGARALEEKVLEVRERTLPADHHDLQGARNNLALTIRDLGDLAGARALQERVLEVCERTLLPDQPDHADLQRARGNLASTIYALGDLAGARALEEMVLEVRERTLSPDHPDLQWARGNLAVTIKDLGDLAGARTLEEKVLEVRERTLPPDHSDLQAARLNLAGTIKDLGDLAGARALQGKVLEVLQRTLPPDHRNLQAARENLAGTMKDLGDLAGARMLEEQVLAVFERTLPPDHPDLQMARGNVANTIADLGDLAGARMLEEQVLAVFERTLPPDHPDLQMARGNLAATMRALGDLAGARALKEKVLDVLERTLPPDHPGLQRARQGLASTIADLGDLAGARALFEKVLEIRELTLLPDHPDHPDLQDARQNLANTIADLGDLAGARALEEKVLEVRERTLPPNHPELQDARQNLANTIAGLGDLAGARALEERVLEVRERMLPPDHPDLQRARHNVAGTFKALGDLAGARALQEKVLEVRERTLPADHPDLQWARGNLAVTLATVRDADPLAQVLMHLVAGSRRGLDAARVLSSREAAERARSMEKVVNVSLSYAGISAGGSALTSQVFGWVETRRAVACASRAKLEEAADDPEVATLHEALLEANRRVSDLSASLPSSRPVAGGVADAVLRRDATERELRAALAKRGFDPVEVDLAPLAAALPSFSSAMGWLRYTRWNPDPKQPEQWTSDSSLLAHVVRPDGTLTRVELGPIASVTAAVERWRGAVGAPLTARGVGGTAVSKALGDLDATRQAGEEIRRLVLDPILAAAGDAKTLHVCLDDALHLVPLDALPLGDGVVGDKYSIRVETSFARLIRPRPASTATPSLVVMGGVDYGARPDATSNALASARIAAAPPVAMDRGASGRLAFPPLGATANEAQGIAATFHDALKTDALILSGERATKSAFAEAARNAKYIHIATHGYFSDANVKAWGEEDEAATSRPWKRMTFEETVKGMSPMSLCGLALAGANRGADSMGRVPGILTAEELAGLDLRNCELAVLSACETNVGIHRAGLGIQSLQAALHAAGARTAITSLWRVPDETTRELMTAFYRRLWLDKKPAAVALWEAKQVIRAKKGSTLRDWAGWVLTGDPGDEPERAASGPATKPASVPITR